jgi:hypothetical protein
MRLVGFEVLTTVAIKNIILWYVTPCSPAEIKDVSEERTASIFSFHE